MTYAGPFGLPQSGGAQIIVRTGEISLRTAPHRFDANRAVAANEDIKVRSLLREVVAIRKTGKKV